MTDASSRRSIVVPVRRALRLVVIILVSIVAATASARSHDEGHDEPEADPAPAEPSGSDPEDGDPAPLPGEARRIVVEPRKGAEQLLWVPRVVLFVPRWVLWGAVQPLRLAMIAYERNAIYERIVDIFFNDARTFGVFPVVRLQRFQGVFVGARLIYRNLFGTGGSLSFRTGAGDRLKQEHRLDLGTGRLLGRWSAFGWAGFRLRPRQNFAGIGNTDIVDVEDPATLPRRIDPYREGIGVRTRFREDELQWGLALQRDVNEDLWIQIAHGWMRKTYTDGVLTGDNYLTSIYDPSSLPGFDSGILQSYTELSFTYDNLHTTSRWVPGATPSRGWRIRGYHGVSRVLVPGGLYQRTGLDLGRFIDLYGGNRVLRLRVKLDLVQGSYAQIPFSELPSLGGAEFLRGYRNDRFRDRLATLTSAEYYFPISQRLAGYLFTDVGRVYPSLGDLSVEDLRVGFGGGLQVHEFELFLGRLQLASSLEGELFFQLRLEPTFQLDDYL